jgi:hypothetical protein
MVLSIIAIDAGRVKVVLYGEPPQLGTGTRRLTGSLIRTLAAANDAAARISMLPLPGFPDGVLGAA